MGVVCTEVVCLGALGLWIGSSGLLDIMFYYLFHTFLLVFLFFSIPLFFCPFVVATTIYLYFSYYSFCCCLFVCLLSFRSIPDVIAFLLRAFVLSFLLCVVHYLSFSAYLSVMLVRCPLVVFVCSRLIRCSLTWSVVYLLSRPFALFSNLFFISLSFALHSCYYPLHSCHFHLPVSCTLSSLRLISSVLLPFFRCCLHSTSVALWSCAFPCSVRFFC